MPDFLNTAFAADNALNWQTLLLRQVIALLLGVAVAMVYRWARRLSGVENQSIPTTLILLTILIAAISAVIGDNVARAFSLVGALSIVRFRTVVEDTRDTAFVILAVGVGMAIGSGHLILSVLLIPLAAVGSLFFRPVNTAGPKGKLTVTTGLGADQKNVEAVIAHYCDRQRSIGLGTTRQGAAVELTYEIALKPSSTGRELLDALQGIEGVMTVEIEIA